MSSRDLRVSSSFNFGRGTKFRAFPTWSPTADPTALPTTAIPTGSPSAVPTLEPTFEPTHDPTMEPTEWIIVTDSNLSWINITEQGIAPFVRGEPMLTSGGVVGVMAIIIGVIMCCAVLSCTKDARGP